MLICLVFLSQGQDTRVGFTAKVLTGSDTYENYNSFGMYFEKTHNYINWGINIGYVSYPEWVEQYNWIDNGWERVVIDIEHIAEGYPEFMLYVKSKTNIYDFLNAGIGVGLGTNASVFVYGEKNISENWSLNLAYEASRVKALYNNEWIRRPFCDAINLTIFYKLN